MRIWDIHPGYLNRQSLLGEHRELHGMVSVFVHHKKGYSRHPETLRWLEYQWGLQQRHRLLSAEMKLRGYVDKTPVSLDGNDGRWPTTYIDTPYDQFQLLCVKYQHKEPGRIPFPKSGQQLWSQHKYSVMARDISLYKQIGREVSTLKAGQEFSALAQQLTEQLRVQPKIGSVVNALQHMWGHVSNGSTASQVEIESWSPTTLLSHIQSLTLNSDERYLIHSTALSELEVCLHNLTV